MTVQTTTRSQTFAGGQSVLNFNFRTLTSNPNYISVNAISGSTTVVLSYSTQYTVAVNASGVGGTVTVSPTYGTNYTYVVYRTTGLTQGSSYSNYNAFPASTVETGLDQLTMITQEESDNASRAVALPIGSNPSISTTLPLPVANLVLAWDPTATFLLNSNLTGSTGAIGPQGPAGPVSSVSSSTSDITVVSTSTTPIITAVNAGTGGANTILRLNANGALPALNAISLSSLPIQAVYSYVTSNSTSFTIATSTIKIAYGQLPGFTTSTTVSGLPFTNALSYQVIITGATGSNNYGAVSNSSGAIATFFTNANNQAISWFAIGT